mmetsp:Transcript_157232/g.272748  ORF Transcript_157232/g.272748 Transcript_157232/m.272748 type:complete len:773 (-) Transcript_157232:82-2400(-)
MKFVAANFFFAMLVLCTAGAELSKERKVMRTGDAVATQDKTITQVVKMLEGILEKSKFEGESERTAYAKYMCDCDKRIEEYTTTIATSQEDITLLANEIAQLKAENGKLSTECAKLTAAIAANEADQAALNSTRADENTKFLAFKSDLDAAIGQLEEAVKTLAEVSADQTLAEATAKDHTKFMSGYVTKYNPVSLLRVKSSLKSVLAVASAAMDDKKARTMASFLQAPFTGSYTSQSVEVMGILKNMKDKFERDVDEAVAQEAAQLEAWTKVIQIKIAEAADMAKSYDKKQLQLASNDDALSTKTGQKTDTEALMEEAESFLAQTEEACAAKKKEYAKRRLLQTQEEAALSEAIAILDSDAAFATFGSVSATSTGSLSFLQFKGIQKHSMGDDHLRAQLMQTLSKVKGSTRLSKLMSVVQATNVFEVVLDEIDKMKALIVEEGKSDKENLDFCNSERTANDATIATKTYNIEQELKPKILQLTNSIEDPESGLKKQIADTEASLVQNADNQKKSTEERTASNLVFQKDMKEIADAKDTLNQAIAVLDAYYKRLDKALKLGLVQKHRAPKENTPVPVTDSAVLKMQGESTSGKDVITKLSFILSETETEEQTEISDEKEEKRLYDETMSTLKGEESTLETSLAKLEGDLAKAEKDLMHTEQEKKAEEDEKAAAEAYLADIKPGCDFITENIVLRTTNRAEETKQLNAAIDLIKGTPVYMKFEAETHLESLKGCVLECQGAEGTATCKACLADVTVPAYCAGHPTVSGCGTSTR